MKYEINRWGKVEVIEADEFLVEGGVIRFWRIVGDVQYKVFVAGYSLANLISWKPV